jgi:hypothetical protein
VSPSLERVQCVVSVSGLHPVPPAAHGLTVAAETRTATRVPPPDAAPWLACPRPSARRRSTLSRGRRQTGWRRIRSLSHPECDPNEG